MRADKRFIITLAVIGIWTVLTYFIIMTNQSSYQYGMSFIEKVESIEDAIEKETQQREQIILGYNSLVQILKKHSTTLGAVPDKIHDGILPQFEQFANSNQIQLNNKIDFNGKYINGDEDFPVIPVLVFACNRVSVSRSLDALIKYRGYRREQFPIIVSQVFNGKTH